MVDVDVGRVRENVAFLLRWQGNTAAISLAAMLNIRRHIALAVEQRGAAHSFSHMMYSLTDVCCVEMVQKLHVPYRDVSAIIAVHSATQTYTEGERELISHLVCDRLERCAAQELIEWWGRFFNNLNAVHDVCEGYIRRYQPNRASAYSFYESASEIVSRRIFGVPALRSVVRTARTLPHVDVIDRRLEAVLGEYPREYWSLRHNLDVAFQRSRSATV